VRENVMPQTIFRNKSSENAKHQNSLRREHRPQIPLVSYSRGLWAGRKKTRVLLPQIPPAGFKLRLFRFRNWEDMLTSS